MKKLIINIDDLGLSKAVNDAAEKCITEGIVTETSVIPCANAFGEAVSILKELGNLDVGVHLSLTGKFNPCTNHSETINSLVGDDGKFYGNYQEMLMKYFLGEMKPDQINNEFKSQIEKVKRAGLRITHVDSHEHIHMLPGISRIAMKLAKKYKIPFVRNSSEKMGVLCKDFSILKFPGYAALKMFTPFVKKRFLSEGIKTNDSFLGHFHSGKINDDVMKHFINNLPEGITEIAIHPCTEDNEFLKTNPWHKNGPIELDVLLNGNWRDQIKSKNIQLITHRDLIADY